MYEAFFVTFVFFVPFVISRGNVARNWQILGYMMRRISIAELEDAGATIRAEEAVAIVQLLIESFRSSRASDPDARPPYGPPTASNVYLSSDGTVACAVCQTMPAVSEVGALLQSILPLMTSRVPGSLRYTVARAVLDVDAPPFDSIDDFSEALARHERGDRIELVCGLLERARSAMADRNGRSLMPAVDRRRATPDIAELRRQLRAADARVYDQQRALDALGGIAKTAAHKGSRRFAVAAGLAIGLMLVGAGELMHRRHEAGVVLIPPRPAQAAFEPQPLDRPAGAVMVERASFSTNSRAVQEPSASKVAPADGRKAGARSAAKNVSSDRSVVRRSSSTGVLGWLRRRIAIRADAL